MKEHAMENRIIIVGDYYIPNVSLSKKSFAIEKYAF